MALNFDGDPNRSQLKFATDGLPAREELLLKSLIRMLDYRTVHHWTYEPEHPDLWILSEGCGVPPSSAGSNTPYKVLHVAAHAASTTNVLVRPLRSDQIEAQLNRLGGVISAAKASFENLPTVPAALLPSEPQHFFAGAHVNPSHEFAAQSACAPSIESYRLLRWPNIKLLNSNHSIRLATVMLGRPLRLAEIAERSQLPEAFCANFLMLLKSEGLLATSLAPAANTEMRQSQISNAQTVALTATAPAPATAKLGLFARIRNRLTLKNPTLS